MNEHLKENPLTLKNSTIPGEQMLVEPLNALSIDLDDDKLASYLKNRIEKAQEYFEKEGVYQRQDENLKALLGKRTDGDFSEYKEHQSKFSDNAIYEGEATIKPILLSRFPDIVVTPGSEDPESKKIAETLTEIVNSDIKKRENRRVMGVAIKHQPIYFLGAIKCVWDENKDDYRFEVVHPKRLVIDHTAVSTDTDGIGLIAEKLSLSGQEILNNFPDKKNKILKILEIEGVAEDSEEYNETMGAEYDLWEVWFEWYDKNNEPVSGTAFTLKDKIIDKQKNPYFDHEGDDLLTGDISSIQNAFSDAFVAGDTIEALFSEEKVYNNFFNHPKKPYYFMGYEQLGEMVYDATSRIEQTKYLQSHLDESGAKLQDMIKRTRGIDVISTEDSGITKEDAEEIDFSDPDIVLAVTGDPNKLHSRIPGEQPSAAAFADKADTKKSITDKMGVHGTTMGDKETDTATTSQILRESDFGRLDDYAEETINAAAEWMASWSLQMIKLFYTEKHFRDFKGADGAMVKMALDRDMVEDGMTVTVGASATDKARRIAEAKEEASMSLIDPLTYFEDIGKPNAKERVKRLMMFNTNPEMYYNQYVDASGMLTPPPALNAIDEAVAPREAITSLV